MESLEAFESSGANYTCNCNRTCPPSISVAFTILSSLGSVVGGILIIGTFLKWKDLRTVARVILVFLAIADLFTGLGYIFGAGLYLGYKEQWCPGGNKTSTTLSNNTVFQNLCAAQSFLTTVFPVASFLWTGNLSIYLFISIGLHKSNFARKLMIPFHVTAWGIPLITCVVLLGKHKLGYSSGQSNAAWCWIRDDIDSSDNCTVQLQQYRTYYKYELVSGKMWEIVVLVVSLSLCLSNKILLWKRYRPQQPAFPSEDSSIGNQIRAAFTKVDQKLIWIPVVFLLVRCWGIIRFFISAPGLAYRNNPNCDLMYLPVLITLQGIGDPGQGWSNALLFVIFNETIFQRLCPCFHACGIWCQGTCKSVKKKFKKKRMKRTHIIKRGLTDGGIVTYGNEKETLITDSLKSSVTYQSLPEDMNVQKKRLETPNADATSINKFTE